MLAAYQANEDLHHQRLFGKYRVRNKFVRVRSAGRNTAGFSSFWNQQYAKLSRYYDQYSPTHHLKRRDKLVLDAQVEEWAKTTLEHMQRDDASILARYSGTQASYISWRDVALWIMYHEPEEMIDFLRFTNVSPLPIMTYVQDSLQYLATHFSHCEDSAKKQENLSALADLFPILAARKDELRLHMDGSFFRLLLPHCTDEQAASLYRTVKDCSVEVNWHTFLHFATFFARAGKFEQALDAILQAKGAKAELDSFAFRSTCATLLRSSIRQPNGLRVCLRIVDNFVQLGLTLNNILCNIVMLNAVEAGDLKTAFSIYDSLVEQGLEADSYTYAILLKGCKAAIDDAESLNATIRNAIEHVDVLEAPTVATEILHCLALHHSKHHPEKAFDTVVDACAQLFDIEPLRKLGIVLPKLSQPSRPAGERLQLNRPALGVIMSTYLEHSFRNSQSTLPAYEVYQKYRALVQAGEEPFASMIQTDHIANAFLVVFIKTKKGLLYAAELIKDMQRTSGDSTSDKHCAPTVQTWSIFLHGFSRHGQLKLAEQVANYMRAKGIQPNRITWNTLLAGYAGAQDFEGTLDVLRRMEADGATWDSWTEGGIRRIHDQQRLHQQWEGRKPLPRIDFTNELKEGLGARLSEAENAAPMTKRPPVDPGGMADSPADLAEGMGSAYTPMKTV